MKIKIDNFDIRQIAQSGQCFRWQLLDNDAVRIIAFGRVLYISRQGDAFDFSCDEDEWNSLWKSYFDMDTDYASIGRMIRNLGNDYLINAYAYGSGIRILKQDVWETIISFMISQNNNIPRIRSSIEKICFAAGIEIAEGLYAFPGPGQINPNVFMDRSLGLGYRSEYLRDMYIYANDNSDWLKSLDELNYEEAMKELLKIKGIGQKVANCICLFGLHHIEAFPIDTHIRSILDAHFPQGLDLLSFKKTAGIVQQYMFYYDLNKNK